jgi:hypothetical protein
MGRGFIKIVRVTDAATGVVVEYDAQNNVARTTGGVTDYVMMSMPNPVPYRGVSIGLVPPGASDGVLYVIASDGTVLVSEARAEDYDTGYARERYMTAYEDYNNWRDNWSGGSDIWMFEYVSYPPSFTYNHKLEFTVPEDCVVFGGGTIPVEPSLAYSGTDGLDSQWAADWTAGAAAFNTRRKAWFKKNSDEFIAGLKTGAALPSAWEFQIKRDVDTKYDSYPYTSIRVGRRTKREIQFSESNFSDTIESDTSANLTQAGVKVTRREATISYSVDGEPTPREEVFIGYLTQTVTRHNDRDGVELGLSRQDVYGNWYCRTGEAHTSTRGAYAVELDVYAQDRVAENFMGAEVINGTLVHGYAADSKFLNPENPLTYATYIPPYPAASSTVIATVPDFFKTWHADAKITYVKDGVGASNAQNDSAMHGVTEVHLTPVGLIADGAGFADAGEAVGMFSSGEDGAQVEIYGTAAYTFNWQEGSFTFKSWKPLLDADGNEVASKTVTLPEGVVWSDSSVNCVITYKGLHWPDVVTAIGDRNRDMSSGTFAYSDPVLYELITAIKAG